MDWYVCHFHNEQTRAITDYKQNNRLNRFFVGLGKYEKYIFKLKFTSLKVHLDFKSQKCSTNPDMFKYFNISEFDTIGSLMQMEATTNIYHRNFVNSLIMKAWVQCALDVDCMANGCLLCKCCSPTGCHRFDQSALTMIISYFFQYPKSKLFLPPHIVNNEPDIVREVSGGGYYRDYYIVRR